ncbi:hypothetical protein [Mycoplasma anserisalpingitidis]|uniref:hypothetical protein n=1 Tax=Mycoplasma anserisalpingitidis TaxID=519450 RepID=UPI0011B14B8F|nr:hypothetical protein [Mycoplasma anserisalpingitidis]QDY87732.1 hypothetical protein FOY45_02220 [Mycoplasma anserisalpingitidis]
MKKEEFLDEIKEYKNYIIKTKINDDIFYDKNMNINKENFIFDNYLDYSNLNKSDISLEGLISDISYNEIPIWDKDKHEYIPYISEIMNEKYNDCDSLNALINTSIYLYNYEMLQNNIEPLIKIHYLDLTKEIINKNDIKEIDLNHLTLKKLIDKKASEFCDADVLNKYIPNEIPELEEMLNKNKKIENSAELAQ